MASSRDRVAAKAHDLYGDEQLANAVLADADKQKTIDRIDTGELVLPHPTNARQWHDVQTGRATMTTTDRNNSDEIHSLKLRLEMLENELAIPHAPPPPVGDPTNTPETHSP